MGPLDVQREEGGGVVLATSGQATSQGGAVTTILGARRWEGNDGECFYHEAEERQQGAREVLQAYRVRACRLPPPRFLRPAFGLTLSRSLSCLCPCAECAAVLILCSCRALSIADLYVHFRL